MCWISGRTHSVPNSTGAKRSRGNRVARPWPMIEATPSLIGDLGVAKERKPGEPFWPGDARPEGAELAAAEALPLVRVALIARVRLVHPDQDVGLLDRLPERVEHRQGERTPPLPGRHRRGVEEEGLRTVGHDELELLQGVVEDRQADHGRRVHRVGVVVRPVLEHPAVEGPQHDLDGIGIFRQPLLHAGGQGRPDERAVDAHVLHEGEAGLGVEEGVDRGDAHAGAGDRPPYPPGAPRGRRWDWG